MSPKMLKAPLAIAMAAVIGLVAYNLHAAAQDQLLLPEIWRAGWPGALALGAMIGCMRSTGRTVAGAWVLGLAVGLVAYGGMVTPSPESNGIIAILLGITIGGGLAILSAAALVVRLLFHFLELKQAGAPAQA